MAYYTRRAFRIESQVDRNAVSALLGKIDSEKMHCRTFPHYVLPQTSAELAVPTQAFFGGIYREKNAETYASALGRKSWNVQERIGTGFKATSSAGRKSPAFIVEALQPNFCKWVPSRLSDFLADTELTPTLTRVVGRHFPRCRSALEITSNRLGVEEEECIIVRCYRAVSIVHVWKRLTW